MASGLPRFLKESHLLGLLALAALPALARASDPSPAGIDVSLFGAHSNDRINATTSSEDEQTAEGLTLGLKLELSPIRRPPESESRAAFQWRLYGAAMLSRRAFEVDSTGDVPDKGGVATRLIDADAGELYIGSRLMWFVGVQDEPNADGWAPRRFAFYARGEYGGISSADSIGDLIDTSFFGVGFEYGHYPFTGSFIEAGLGTTDLFAPDHRDGRKKFRMGIEYTLIDRKSISKDALYPPSAVFVHIRVDADTERDARDGVRVVAGARLDAFETLNRITGILGLTD